MKNILILGGFGFIGKNLIEELLQTKESYNFIVFEVAGKTNIYGNKIKVYYGDFNNEESLDLIFKENSIDIVLHLISSTIPASSNESIIFDIETNLVPTVRLLKLMTFYKIPEIIFFSSGGSVYGVTKDEKVDENHATFPISSHGTIKIAIEKYIHLFQELYGINYLILRVGNPFGPYHSSERQGLINVFMRKMLINEEIIVRGDGSAVRDYIYVKDLAKIVHLLIKNEIRNEIINVGSGIGYSINQVIDILKEKINYQNSVAYEEALPSDVPNIVLNPSKLESLVK